MRYLQSDENSMYRPTFTMRYPIGYGLEKLTTDYNFIYLCVCPR